MNLLNLHLNIHRYGWKVLVSFIFPVYWKQDTEFKNNGFDIITITKPDKCYCHCTWRRRNELWRN